MEKEQPTKFEVLSELLEIRGKKLSEGAINRMLKAFDDISDENFETAIDSLLKSSNTNYMPTPEEIRDKVFSELDSTQIVVGVEKANMSRESFIKWCAKKDREELDLSEEEYLAHISAYEDRYDEPYEVPMANAGNLTG